MYQHLSGHSYFGARARVVYEFTGSISDLSLELKSDLKSMNMLHDFSIYLYLLEPINSMVHQLLKSHNNTKMCYFVLKGIK